jgi:hypothetical protein
VTIGAVQVAIDMTASLGRPNEHSDSSASTDVAMLAQLLGSEQGVTKHREKIGWRQESKNTLGRIKKRVDYESVS